MYQDAIGGKLEFARLGLLEAAGTWPHMPQALPGSTSKYQDLND